LHRLDAFHPARPVLIAVLVLLAIASSALAQQTIHIPADQPTIQAGINAASNGDTVLVAPGTYYENLDFKGKAITVTSSAGPATTVIDGSSTGPAVAFKTGETSSSAISGFAIQHGGSFSVAVGSIYLHSSTPTILNNIITLSNCWGIDSNYSAPLIQNNTISATQDPHGSCSFGGGSAIIVRGGIHNLYNQSGVQSGLILGNTIENNVESGFEDAGGNGGAGIAVWGGAPIIENNIIRNNSSPGGSGGAINFVNSQKTLIAQNLIYGNSAGCGGGAIATDGHGLYVMNNTIVDNVGVGNAGYSECANIAQIYPSPDAYGYDSPSDVFINNIISGSTTYPAVNCSWYSAPSETIQPTFQNNILYNAGGAFFGSHCVDVSSKYNNLVGDPQFVSPSTGDYHLKSTSPAIDAGQNSVLQTFLAMTGQALSKDFDGRLRVQDATGSGCVIDMGAYEYPGTVSICGTIETLTSSLNPATVGQSVTFSAQLTATTGVPTGAIQFLDGTNILSTQPVSGSGSSAYTTSSLGMGSHTIAANYQPAGNFSASAASLTQVINGYTTGTTLTCSPNPIGVFSTALLTATVTSANGIPTGSITFTDNGNSAATQALLNGASNFTYTGSLAQTHTITATYTPTGPFAASSATCSEVVTPLPTISVLAVSPSTSPYGSPVTLTATVSPSTLPGPSTPTGLVTFYDGAASIAAVSLDSSRHAALTTATLTVGTHTLNAVYAGNSTYAASTSAAVLETINPLPADFAITLATPSITIRTQHHTTTTLTLASVNGFADSLTISCANLPQYLTCRPTPGTASLSANGSATVSLYLDTDSVLGYARNTGTSFPSRIPPITWAFLVAPLTLLGCTRSRRHGKPGVRLLMFALAVLPLSLALAGCGQLIISAEIPPSVAPGTYIIPITATGSVSGISHTAQLTLQVTP
jgi:hypothetical protein